MIRVQKVKGSPKHATVAQEGLPLAAEDDQMFKTEMVAPLVALSTSPLCSVTGRARRRRSSGVGKRGAPTSSSAYTTRDELPTRGRTASVCYECVC